MRIVALALLGLLWAVPLQAQTVCEFNCEISQSAPFVAFTEVDATATSYALFTNGVASPAAVRVVNGLVEFVFASGLPRGSYQFVIIAYDAGGEAWRTEPNTLTVKPGRRVVKFR